jgi:hypothetical protein
MQRERKQAMFIERKVYPMGNNEFAAVYEITDTGHEVKLSSEEAWDLLEWLNVHRGEIFRELHPEIDQEREEADLKPHINFNEGDIVQHGDNQVFRVRRVYDTRLELVNSAGSYLIEKELVDLITPSAERLD